MNFKINFEFYLGTLKHFLEKRQHNNGDFKRPYILVGESDNKQIASKYLVCQMVLSGEKAEITVWVGGWRLVILSKVIMQDLIGEVPHR